MAKRGRASGLRSQVSEYLHRRPGEEVFVTDIAKDLGLTKKQVQNCVTNAMREGAWPDVEIVTRGNSWRFIPDNRNDRKSNKRMFEEIGVTKDGSIVIQDTDGNLYRALVL